jgi:predicted site-specific integrase-resolvase
MMTEMRATNADLSRHSQFLEQEQLTMKEAIADIKFKLEEVRKHIPKKVLKRLIAEGTFEAKAGGEDQASRCVIC